MKKFTLLAMGLLLPFFMVAQWSFLFTTAGGVASENGVTPPYPNGSQGSSYTPYSTVGPSLQGGVEADYYFSCSRLGLGSGIFYSYNRSLQTLDANPVSSIRKEYWHAESIRIVANLFVGLGKSRRSVLLFGLAGNFNLRHHQYATPDMGSTTYRDNPFFAGIQTGYKYKWGKRFVVGVLLYRDVSWFVNQISYEDSQGHVAPFSVEHRYYHTAQLTFSYRFGGALVVK